METVGNIIGGRTGVVLACLFGLASRPAVAGELERFEFTRIRMGIPFNITVYADDEAAVNSIADEAYRRIKELNDIFSDYHPQSETNRLVNNAVPGKPAKAGPDLVAVLLRAQQISQQSNGAFDVTVSPAVKLWRRAWRTKVKPSAGDLAEALSKVGYRHLIVDRKSSTVTFTRPGISLDFGAIAKGYACDEALKVFRRRGLTRVLIEAGGDLSCGDPPPDKKGWTIAVETLASADKLSSRLLTVSNCGVATSGDAYQFIELDGVRYSHIVDPMTGLGLTTPSSVTIIAADGTTADALASAVSVLGPEKGAQLVGKIDRAEMLMVYAAGDDTLKSVQSAGFPDN